MTLELIKIGLSLVFVLGIIMIASRVLMNRMGGSQNQFIKTLGFLSLGPRKAIAVVKAGKEVILIGVTHNDLKLIKAYPEEEFATELQSLKKNLNHLKLLKDTLRSEIK
jgi:flagellar protein FliO/FliZ